MGGILNYFKYLQKSDAEIGAVSGGVFLGVTGVGLAVAGVGFLGYGIYKVLTD